jgi:hypothetical protein
LREASTTPKRQRDKLGGIGDALESLDRDKAVDSIEVRLQ